MRTYSRPIVKLSRYDLRTAWQEAIARLKETLDFIFFPLRVILAYYVSGNGHAAIIQGTCMVLRHSRNSSYLKRGEASVMSVSSDGCNLAESQA